MRMRFAGMTDESYHGCLGFPPLANLVGMFCLLQGEEEQHRDVHKHLFGQPFQQLSSCGLACNAVHALKVRVNDPEVNGHGILPTPFDLRLRVSPFVCREAVQNLLDLPIRLCTAIDPSHDDNHPSAHVMVAMLHPKRLLPHPYLSFQRHTACPSTRS
jgi:hypothetical protein